MNIDLCLFIFLLCYYFGESAQPYFPSQIVFTLEDDRRTYAIDEVNQRAYSSFKYDASVIEESYVMKNFPYTLPDSPRRACMYGTY